MNLFNINISFSYWKFMILGCIALFFLGLIIWIICSYYTYKWFKMNIDKDYFYFNKYNSDELTIVMAEINRITKKYGNFLLSVEVGNSKYENDESIK